MPESNGPAAIGSSRTPKSHCWLAHLPNLSLSPNSVRDGNSKPGAGPWTLALLCVFAAVACSSPDEHQDVQPGQICAGVGTNLPWAHSVVPVETLNGAFVDQLLSAGSAGVVVVGHESSDCDSNCGAFIVEVASDGSSNFVGLGAAGFAALTSVVARGDGRWWAGAMPFGWTGHPPIGPRAPMQTGWRVALFNDDWSYASQVNGQSANTLNPQALVPVAGSDGVVALGVAATALMAKVQCPGGRIASFDDSGKRLWDLPVSQCAPTALANADGDAPGTRYYVGGRSDAEFEIHGLDSDGTPAWTGKVSPPQQGQRPFKLFALEPLEVGAVIMAGSLSDQSTHGDVYFLAAVEHGGSVLWQLHDRTFQYPHGITRLGENVLVVANSSMGTLSLAALLQYTPWGALHSRRVFAAPYSTHGRWVQPPFLAYGLDVHEDGTIWLAARSGELGDDGAWRGEIGLWVARLTAWGHATCAESGVCAALSLSDCDDKDPCTRDGCHPKTGCTHVPWPDDTPCAKDSSCQSGHCQPVP